MSLERHPGLTVARFGHNSAAYGHQVWDEVGWPLFVGSVSETFILSELYDATLSFWTVRR